MPLSVLPASLSGCDQQPEEADDTLPLCAHVRTALLDRLEAWIEEEERLIAELDRKIAAALGAATTPRAHAKTGSEAGEPIRGAVMTGPLAAA